MTDGKDQASREVCLCILFNHPFAANIPLLRAMYASRFPLIRFLIPFEESSEPDVLTVYRGSFAHSAFVADHLDALLATGATHFIIVQDDVLLSPYLNANTIVDALGLDQPGDGYIGGIGATPPSLTEWGFQLGSAWRLLHPRNYASGTGVDSLATVLRYLPSLDVAQGKAAALGVPPTTVFHLPEEGFTADLPPAFRYFGQQQDGDVEFATLLAAQLTGSGRREIELPYPIATSGPLTDFYAVSRDALADFARFSAILTTAGLFVEMAAPTALMLACGRIRTDQQLGNFQSYAPSFVPPRAALADLYADRSLISVHPVKLSQVDNREVFSKSCDPSTPAGRALAQRDIRSAVLEEFPSFDPELYIAAHPDLMTADAPAYEHFYRFGLHEKRQWRPVGE
jgi:hypothetical protein